MAVGNATAMSVSLASAGAILGSSATAFMILKLLGASYLIAVGLIAIVRSSDTPAETGARRPITPRAAFMTCFFRFRRGTFDTARGIVGLL